jgi:hypothetical protein
MFSDGSGVYFDAIIKWHIKIIVCTFWQAYAYVKRTFNENEYVLVAHQRLANIETKRSRLLALPAAFSIQ